MGTKPVAPGHCIGIPGRARRRTLPARPHPDVKRGRVLGDVQILGGLGFRV